MKKIVLLLLFGLYLLNAHGQQVVVTDDASYTGNSSALLDVHSKNGNLGMLIPQVTLTGESDNSTISNPANGLLVFHTGTASLQEGFYFWSSTDNKWKLLYSGNVPSVPGNTVYWVRPTGSSYIQPEGNEYIHIYDAGQTYGVYYDGSTNQYGVYSITGNSTDPTAAVVGFSNVSGNQTYGYLGYNGTYNSGTGFGSLDGMAVYGMVDDPNRAAGFFRTTSNASVASLISYSDVWIASYNYTYDNRDQYSPPCVYGQLDVTTANQSYYAGLEIAVEGLSLFYPSSSNGATTVGLYGYAGGDDKDDDGYLDRGYQNAIGTYSYAYTQGSYWATGVLGVSNCQVSGSDYYNNNFGGVEGQGAYNNIQYGFGVVGRDASSGNRSGGVLGTWWTSVWAALGYQNSSGNSYGICYVGGATTTAKDNDIKYGIGFGGVGSLIGGWSRGEVYGFTTKGDRYSLYVDGKQYTNDVITELSDVGGEERVASYVPTSSSVDIITRGTAKLNGGKAYIKFDKEFASLVSDKEPITITATPIGASNGVYIESVKSDGFVIAENNGGKSNVTVNWIAIGTKKGYENPSNPAELLSNDYDSKMEGVMFNESDLEHSATPIWWDESTQQLHFTKIPQSIDKSKSIDIKEIKPKVEKNKFEKK